MTFKGFPLLASSKAIMKWNKFSSLMASVGQNPGAFATRLMNHYCAVGSSVQLNSVSQKTTSRQRSQKLKTVCNIWGSHKVLMAIQPFCNVTEFRLTNSCRRFGGSYYLHLDSQAVQQRYTIHRTQGFVKQARFVRYVCELVCKIWDR